MVVSYSVLIRLIKLCKKIVVKENRFNRNPSARKLSKNLLRQIILYGNDYFRTLRKLHKLISVSLTNLLCIFGLGYTTLNSVSVSRDFSHTKSCTIPPQVLLSPHSREYLRQREDTTTLIFPPSHAPASHFLASSPI
ncbi:hypothetical protein W5Q_04971 [Candida albicans SC5314]|nr:hypothetical protein W5Q_04971 [Candida albicans SC5314]